jgi:tryptophanyl-tRNA synthetase
VKKIRGRPIGRPSSFAHPSAPDRPAGPGAAPTKERNDMSRRISGFKPTGYMHLGNYLGAIRPMVAGQRDGESVVFIADMHAMTIEHVPADLHARTLENATLMIAAGVDPEVTTLYVQSHVRAHADLHYLLECATGYGEAHRMIQFKEKAAHQEHVRLSLLTYPVLMAADILLHDITDVPVGTDQTQHVELTRDVAVRFNSRYGDTFVVPKAVNPVYASRIKDLADPARKMGKSTSGTAGAIRLLDPPDTIARKIRRAVTDTGTEVRYEPESAPGVSNLLEILAGCTGAVSPTALAGQFDSYGQLKSAVTDAVIDTLGPVQMRYAPLAADPARVRMLLRRGADRARARADATVARAAAALGLLPA